MVFETAGAGSIFIASCKEDRNECSFTDVIGSGIYSEKSSICAAAYHSGFVKKAK
jgi:hypothetical protein